LLVEACSPWVEGHLILSHPEKWVLWELRYHWICTYLTAVSWLAHCQWFFEKHFFYGRWANGTQSWQKQQQFSKATGLSGVSGRGEAVKATSEPNCNGSWYLTLEHTSSPEQFPNLESHPIPAVESWTGTTVPISQVDYLRHRKQRYSKIPRWLSMD
jgi:hypothetical protein